MGILDLMCEHDGWEMVVTYGADDNRWRARLHKPDDADAPVYFGVSNPHGTILSVVQLLDNTVQRITQTQEA